MHACNATQKSGTTTIAFQKFSSGVMSISIPNRRGSTTALRNVNKTAQATAEAKASVATYRHAQEVQGLAWGWRSVGKVHEFEVVQPNVAFAAVRRDAGVQRNFKRRRVLHRGQGRVQIQVHLLPLAQPLLVAGRVEAEDGQPTGLAPAQHIQPHEEPHVAFVVEFEVDLTVPGQVVELFVGGCAELRVCAVQLDVP